MSAGPLDKQIQICVSQSDIIAVSMCYIIQARISAHANGEERFFQVDGRAAVEEASRPQQSWTVYQFSQICLDYSLPKQMYSVEIRHHFLMSGDQLYIITMRIVDVDELLCTSGSLPAIVTGVYAAELSRSTPTPTLPRVGHKAMKA